MSLRIGRVGIDINLESPNRWDLDGDDATIDVYLHATPDESALLALQLAGLMDRKGDRQVAVVWDAWPAVDGWYEDLDLTVRMMGSSLAHGLWRLSGKMRRVAAGTRFESMLYHGRRAGTAVGAGNADPLVGIPSSATTYSRDGVGLGTLVERAIAPDSGSGPVLVDIWADTDDQADAYVTVPPSGANDGAARLRVGAPPVDPATLDDLLPRAQFWIDARDGVDGGTLADLSGNGNDAAMTVIGGRPIGTLSHPDDGLGPVRFLGTQNNGSTALTAPAVTFTDGMFMAFRGKSIGDPTANGVYTQAYRILQDTSGDLSANTGFSLSQNIATGEISVGYKTASSLAGGTFGGAGITDVDETCEFAGSVVAATGVITAYVRDDANADVTVDGRGWRIVGTTSLGAVTTGTPNGDLAACLGRGMCDYAYVANWNGTTATQLAKFDAADGDPFDTTVTTGTTTWTVNGRSQLISDEQAVVSESGGGDRLFEIPDHPLLDPAGSHTIAVSATPLVINDTFDTFMAKFTGSLGVNAIGWVFANGTAPGLTGAGVIVGSGGSPTLATGGYLTVARHTLAFTVDRGTDDLYVYVDGVEIATADISALGSMDNTATLKFMSGIGGSFFGAAIWHRALTEDQHGQVADEFTGTMPAPFDLAGQLAAYKTLVGRQVPGDVGPGGGWMIDNGLWREYPKPGNPSVIVHEAWDGDEWHAFEWRWAPDDTDFELVYLQVKANTLAEVTVEIGARLSGGFNYQNHITARRGDRNAQVRLPGGYIAVDGNAGTNITGAVKATTAVRSATPVISTSQAAARQTSPMGITFAGETTVGFGVEIPSAATVDQAAALSQQFAAWVDETVRLRGSAA